MNIEVAGQNTQHEQKWYQDYDFVLKQFERGIEMLDETVFYFRSEENLPNKFPEDYYIGYLPKMKKPYWAGYCDIPGGCEYSTAKELFEAKIYDGKSIKQRWQELVLVSIGGLNVNDIDEQTFDWWYEHQCEI